MRSTLRLDTTGLEEMLKKLESVGGDARKVVNDLLPRVQRRIQVDTVKALGKENLPRLGKYSQGDTKRSVVTDDAVRWEGDSAWIPIGFNFAEQGAGGFLITGTPRMQPDKELHRMYKQKKYMNAINKILVSEIADAIIDAMVKGK